MTKSRQDAKVTRLDVRLPNDVHAQIEEIARVNKEPTHHITGNIILTPTVVKLIKLGIRSISGEYPTLANILAATGQLSDSLTPRIEAELVHRVTTLEGEIDNLKQLVVGIQDKLSESICADMLADTQSDTLSVNLADNAFATGADIQSISNTENKLSEATSNPKGSLTISELVKQLDRSRQAIEQRRDSEAGLTDWGYKAEKIGRNWHYQPII